jgi:hypothetical protein
LRICNLAYGQNGWLGVAGISIDINGHITTGYTKLNDSYFSWDFYNQDDWKQSVTCQELGHNVGLDHQDENFNNQSLFSCMDYQNPPYEYPNGHDYDQLEAIYDHIDASGGARGGGARGFNPQPQAPPAFVEGDWGDLVRSRGRVALFRLNLGNGNYVFTFVIRA